MRFPRLNSDFVSSKSEAFAITYPKKNTFSIGLRRSFGGVLYFGVCRLCGNFHCVRVLI